MNKTSLSIASLIIVAIIGFSQMGQDVPAPKEPAKVTAPAKKPAKVEGAKSNLITAPTPRQPNWITNMDQLDQVYMARHANNPDLFWLVGDESMEEHMTSVKVFTTRVRSLMKARKDTSPLSREIYDEFNDFQVSEYINGASQMFFMDKDSVDALLNGAEPTLEFCVISMQQYQRYQRHFPSKLYYRQDWRAVMSVGIVVPDSFLTALTYYGMGHALRHKQGAASATAPSHSDIFIHEEMEMHELEHQVLNAMTSGQLEVLYEKIRMRTKSFSVPTEVLAVVIQEDLREFDRITGVDKAGTAMASIYAAQFYTGLGIYVINQTAGLGETKQRKIAFYREMFTRMNH